MHSINVFLKESAEFAWPVSTHLSRQEPALNSVLHLHSNSPLARAQQMKTLVMVHEAMGEAFVILGDFNTEAGGDP